MSKKSRKRRKSLNKSRHSSSDNNDLSYEALEDKVLLAVDFGLDFTGASFGSETTNLSAEAQGDIGTTHSIEVINDRVAAFDRFTGGRVYTKTLEQFFTEAGGSVFSDLQTPRVVFDHFRDRFFVAAVGEGVLPNGRGNWVYFAWSNTSDPRDGWQTSQFVGDSTSAHHNDDLTLSLDEDAIYMTTNNTSPTSVDDVLIYSIPKSDLLDLADPTITNMSRFEGLDADDFGWTIQVALNYEASDGKAVAIGWKDVATVAMVEIFDTDAAGATIGTPTEIKVDIGEGAEDIDGKYVPQIAHDDYNNNLDEYFRAPDLPGQNEDPLFGPFLDVKPGITASVMEANGSVWGAQTVSIVGINFQSAINWFEIDIDAGRVRGDTPAVTYDGINNQYQLERAIALLPTHLVELRGPQSHLIRAEVAPFLDPQDTGNRPPGSRPYLPPGANVDDPNIYLFNPSIAVNEYGIVAISYNQIFEDQWFGAYTTVGVSVEGSNRHNVQLEVPFEVRPGVEEYDPDRFNLDPWHGGSLRLDPLNKNGFYNTQLWANVDNSWSVQNSQLLAVDLTAIIETTNSADVVTVRRSAVENDVMEVVINGVVTDRFPYAALGRVEIWTHDGPDRILIDYVNGDPTPDGGFLFYGGSGTDRLETNNPAGSEFMVVDPDHRVDRLLPDFASNYPRYLRQYQVVFGDDNFNSNGFYNQTSEIFDIEDYFGGPGDDTFIFTEDYLLSGSANGQGGDDTFRWVDSVFRVGLSGVDGTIEGGTGYDTLNFEDRETPTDVVLEETGELLDGFSGRIEVPVNYIDPLTGLPFDAGPIGQLADGDNFFNDINNIEGSTQWFLDSITFLDRPGGEWVIDDENSSYSVDGATMNFWQVNVLNGSSFDDLWYIVRNNISPVIMNGLGGDDTYIFSSDKSMTTGTTDNINAQVFAYGGSGANKLYATNIDGSGPGDILVVKNSVSGLGEFAYAAVGGTIDLDLTSTPFADKIAVHSYDPKNTLKFFADEGDDEFSVQDLSKSAVELHGEGGDDNYIIERINDIDFRNLLIIDSIGDEADRVTSKGTVLNETFTITSTTFDNVDVDFVGIENFGVDGAGGFDVFNIVSTAFDLFIFGGDRDDVINISSDAPTQLGDLQSIFGDITIDAGRGDNILNISNYSGLGQIGQIFDDRMEGIVTGTIWYDATNGRFARPDGQVGGIHFVGSSTDNDFMFIEGLNAQHTLLVETLGGNDQIRTGTDVFGTTVVDGGDDADKYVFDVLGSGSRLVEVLDTGSEADQAVVIGTPGADDFIISPNNVRSGSERFTFLSPIFRLDVQGRSGNDTYTLNGSQAPRVHMLGEAGDDTFDINNTAGILALRVAGHGDNDTLNFNGGDAATIVRGVGGDGDDTFNVGSGALGTFDLNGNDGSDTYNVTFVGSGDRWVDTRDNGPTGFDVTNVFGSDNFDDLEVRATRVLQGNETVVYWSGNDQLNVDGRGGLDFISVYATQAADVNIFGGSGSDNLNVFTTAGPAQDITIAGGIGNDRYLVENVRATTTLTLEGEEGNDYFQFGSTAADDDGNIGRIRGTIAVLGGPNTGGLDSIYVNDNGVNAGYSYALTSSRIEHMNGPYNVLRPHFKGISYGGVEFVQMIGSEKFNYFEITPAPNTQFLVDGRNPVSSPNQGDSVTIVPFPGDGHELTITDPAKGDGFWTFTNGFEVVEFKNMEEIINP